MKIPSCSLCPRRCRVPRYDDASLSRVGRCGAGGSAYIARADLHMWEEPVISGERGSGAIFFAGCPLGCVYCQNHDISRGEAGQKVTPQRMAEIFRELEDKGAHNINLVTGTHFIPAIIAAMRIYRPRVPVVWNTSGYETLAAIDAIAPYVDIWLPDYKYALPEAAEKYSGAPDYPDIAMAAIERMRHHAPRDTFDDDGMMTGGVIVRHLVLPANTRNSVAALRRLHDRLPDTLISLMSQYTPVCGMERYPELSRRITAREYDKVCDVVYELSIDGFMQERSSSSSAYIPDWDMN